MSTNAHTGQEGTDAETVTVELQPSDLRQLIGLCAVEQARCQRADEPAEQDAAPMFGRLEQEFATALQRAV